MRERKMFIAEIPKWETIQRADVGARNLFWRVIMNEITDAHTLTHIYTHT